MSSAATFAERATVSLIYGRGEVEYERAVELHVTGTVLARFGQWVLTDVGVECLATPYQIPKARVHDAWWLTHMSTKRWVNHRHFCLAIDAARRQWPRTARAAATRPHRQLAAVARPSGWQRALPVSVRFRVLKRDGYRCQLCGASASREVRLEVDHRVARANGGTDELANLWTLCWDCNRGKGTHDL